MSYTKPTVKGIRNGKAHQIEWAAEPKSRYEIQRRDDLHTEWRVIATVKATQTGESFIDFEAKIGVRSYYRVRVVT